MILWAALGAFAVLAIYRFAVVFEHGKKRQKRHDTCIAAVHHS